MIKTREIFSFLPLINNSVIKHISNHIIEYDQNFSSFIWIIFFRISVIPFILFEYSIKAFESLKYFKPVLSLLLISNYYFASYESLAYK